MFLHGNRPTDLPVTCTCLLTYIDIQYTSTYIYILLNIILKKYKNTYTAPMALFFPFWPQITCRLMLLRLRLVFIQSLLVLL